MRRMLPLLVVLGCHSNDPKPAPTGGMTVSGPFVHENLAVYIVEDPSARDAGEFLTLEEGLASGAVTVTEKGNVNELVIENKSDRPCFVQAGDVVKGGQQDRAIGADFVVPPKSGPTGIPSFCVERGRWSGGKAFYAGSNGVYSKECKMAVQLSKNQDEVWENVRRDKERMTGANGLEASKTDSVNEELERKEIVEKLKRIEAALGGLLRDRPKAVGMIFAVNGTLHTADVYGSPSLFRKLYPRLLKTAAADAVATKPEKKEPPAAGAARDFLSRSREGTTREERIQADLRATCTDNAKSVRFGYVWKGSELHTQAIEK